MDSVAVRSGYHGARDDGCLGYTSVRVDIYFNGLVKIHHTDYSEEGVEVFTEYTDKRMPPVRFRRLRDQVLRGAPEEGQKLVNFFPHNRLYCSIALLKTRTLPSSQLIVVDRSAIERYFLSPVALAKWRAEELKWILLADDVLAVIPLERLKELADILEIPLTGETREEIIAKIHKF